MSVFGCPILLLSRIQFALLAAWAHCWLIVSLMLTSNPRSCSAGLVFSHYSPSSYWCPELPLPLCIIWHFILLNIMPLMTAQCSNLHRSYCKTSQASRVKYTSKFCVISKKSYGVYNCCIQIIYRSVEQNRSLG